MSAVLPSPEGLTGARGSASKVVHSCGRQVGAGCCQEASVSRHMDFSIGLLECPHAMAAGFLRVDDSRRSKVEATISFIY